MIKLANCIVMVFLLLISGCCVAAEPSPVGYWKTVDDVTGKAKSIIQITESSNHTLSGKILKIIPRLGQQQQEFCTACQGERHNARILGMQVLEGLSKLQQPARAWSGGVIVDPKNGKSYQCAIALSKNGQLLNVRGYMGMPLFGRTQTWVRVKNV